MKSERPPTWKKLVKRTSAVLLVLVCLGAVASSVYFYRELSAMRNDPQQQAAADMEQLVELVGELIVLPEGEQPTVATVSDVEKLRDQAFFANAKDGDRVLLYANAKKAILYDPTAHKIVEVAPINIGEEAAETPEPSVAGTTTEVPAPVEPAPVE
jgi:hypothetical protein